MLKQLLQELDSQPDERRIHEIVSESLSGIGRIESLKVFDLEENKCKLILVTMESPQASISAANSLGLISFGERSLLITIPNRQS